MTFSHRHHIINVLSKKLPLFFLLLILLSQQARAQSSQSLPDSVTAIVDSATAAVHDVATDTSTTTVQPEIAVLRKVPDSTVRRFKRDKDFAYANDPAYWEKEKEPTENDKNFLYYLIQFLSSAGVRIFLYILMGAVLIFALYKIIVDNRLYLFYSKPKKLKILETEEENLSIENIDDKINEALAMKNYRLAVRYMFLKTLRLLSEKEMIKFHAQGTNHEYALQLGNAKVGKDFQYLARVYEYVWYGEFGINENQNETVRQNFNQFYSAIEK